MTRLKKNLPAYKNLVFAEYFQNTKAVADNGGAFTGTPTINNGFENDGTADQYVSYPNMLNKNWTNSTIIFKCRFDDTASGASRAIGTDHTLGNNYEMRTALSSEWAFIWGDGTTNRTQKISAGGETGETHVYAVVWDGTGSTAYKDGAAVGTSVTSGTYPIWPDTAFRIGEWASADFDGKVFWVEIYNKALSAAEIADRYQEDTYSAVDFRNADIYLPLKGRYYKASGTELLTDGDMEAAGTANWAGAAGATITKETGTRTGGSGVQILRITDAGSTGYTQQAVTTAGRRYRATGWARTDGVAGSTVRVRSGGGGTILWTGTVAGTNWEYFNVIFTDSGNSLVLAKDSSNGNYVEFDDVTCQLMEAQTDNDIPNGSGCLLGDGYTTTTFPTQLNPNGMSFDGGTDYIDCGTSPFTNTAATMGCLVYIASAAASGDVMFSDGKVLITHYAAGNAFFISWDGGTTTLGAGSADKLPRTQWNSFIITRNAAGDSTKAYVNGVLINSGNAGTPATGTENFKVGKLNSSAQLFHGNMKHPFVFDGLEATANQVKYLDFKLKQLLNK